MAIKINWQNLQRRMINGVDVQKVMLNWVQIRPEATPVYTPWIYHNPTRGIISLSANWTDWITIADKNDWASSVSNYWDTRDTDKVWLFFQWGNSYWFRIPNQWTGSQYTDISNYYATSETQVDSSLYPDWYDSSTYIVGHQFWTLLNGYNYAAGHLWPTWTTLKWETWFHIPTDSEWSSLFDILSWWGLCGWYNRCAWNSEDVFRYLKLPKSSRISDTWFFAYELGDSWTYYWATTTYSWWPTSVMLWTRNYWYYPTDGDAKGNLVREFRNTPVVPDTTRTVLYQPN